ncbi:MAG: cation:proton antiporter, partial [Oscillospiraceae bacterium]|nr:cation:proton antiporter [Oscillospiraceae bacterium]
LVAGVLIGPSLLGGLNILGLGFHSFEELETLGVISDMALGFIAFSIGNEFRLSQLRETGRQALVIGILQAVITTLIVDCALLGVHFLFPAVLSIPAAITLGAIAAATAPAATLMVVRQYKAKGKRTDLLLPIVALDDAVGLIVFAVSFGIARALGSGSVDIYGVLVNPLLEILCSLLLGALAGFVLSKLEPIFHSNRNRVAMSISFVFLTVALSMLKLPAGKATVGFSSLLVCMMLGSVFCNLCPLSDEIMHNADRWSAPLLVLFFVISGAELELGVFARLSSVLVGLVYIVSRSLGKYFGARESSRMVGCDKKVVDYLGITLLPQAGVALGMCVTASQLPGDGPMIRNIVLFAVLVYELLGPVATKWALTKAGDIQPKSEEVLKRRERKLAAAAERK